MNENRTGRNIEILYETSCCEAARETAEWLEKEGIAMPFGNPLNTESGFGRLSYTALIEIAADSAIIFISDKATANQDWQDYVNALPETLRRIPVGELRNVDYSNPKVVPPSIEEINFIRLDDRRFPNILDSLITDPGFYHMKNRLLIRYSSWILNRQESSLLTDRKVITEYRERISGKLSSEQDPEMQKQLEGLLEYLKASETYTKKIRRRKISRWILRGILVAAVIALLLGIRWLASYYRRATNANLVASVDVSTGEPAVNAIKMAEGITNPFSADSAKKIAYSRLVQLLDKVWEQTPAGMNYRYILNDYAIPDGSRYLWTADESGKALLWDTWEGTILEKEQLSADPLYTIAADQEGTAAAMDAAGRLYVKTGGRWKQAGESSVADPSSAHLLVSQDRLLALNSDSAELFEMEGDTLIRKGALSIGDLQADNGRILEAGILEDRSVLLAFSREDQLCRILWDGENRSEEKSFPIIISAASLAAVRDNQLVVIDTSGQVYRILGDDLQTVPLVLPQAIAIGIVNENTLVYHERNRGTGLFDMEHAFDYGDVLGAFPAVTDLKTTENLLVLTIQYDYHSIALEELLPVQNTDAIQTIDIFDSSSFDAREAEAILRSVRITSEGLLHLTASLAGEETDVVLDPAGIMENESGYTYLSSMTDLPDSWSAYEDEPYLQKAVPVVVGLRYIPADGGNNTDFSYVLIGMDDGTFAEIGIERDSGLATTTCLHQIPSRSPIISIRVTENGYLLTDQEGLVWNCRSGVGTMTEKGIYAAIRQKNHSGVTTDLLELISPELKERLDLHVYPGGDGKEWES